MYYLLPFKFERINNYEIIVNEVGDFLATENGTAQRIVEKKIDKSEELYKNLTTNFFICEKPIHPLIDNLAIRLRTKKAFLDNFTALHIFVLTLRCNQNCVYCQASSKTQDSLEKDMSLNTMSHAIDLMFQSPSPHLTMELQGGEPTMVKSLIEFAVNTAEEKNKKYNKQITYVICTNCVDISDDLLKFCKKHNILISTSLDGHKELHNENRGRVNSYSNVERGIKKVRDALGYEQISALMTTSLLSTKYPKEIIDAYIENGFSSIFLRALNPYGLASEMDDWDDYYMHYINFYKKALDYIIELNKSGVFFVEEFTALILQKILTPFSSGFVDLQSPSGIINSVVVYNYDGYVYASDESRMLAEFGDYTFQLGKVEDKYEDIFYGKKAQEISKIWANETLAGCSDCAYQLYCGADPVRNYSTQGDMYGFRPTSSFCKKHKQIIEHIFMLLIERKNEVMPIFKQWINRSNF